jgi:hypothetical protein
LDNFENEIRWHRNIDVINKEFRSQSRGLIPKFSDAVKARASAQMQVTRNSTFVELQQGGSKNGDEERVDQLITGLGGVSQTVQMQEHEEQSSKQFEELLCPICNQR